MNRLTLKEFLAFPHHQCRKIEILIDAKNQPHITFDTYTEDGFVDVCDIPFENLDSKLKFRQRVIELLGLEE